MDDVIVHLACNPYFFSSKVGDLLLRLDLVDFVIDPKPILRSPLYTKPNTCPVRAHGRRTLTMGAAVGIGNEAIPSLNGNNILDRL